jgi:ribosomal protein L29
MTIKTKKTKKSNNSNTKTKVPKNLEQKINELKKIQVELDDCMYSNCKSMSKKEITDMLEKVLKNYLVWLRVI